MKKWYLRVLARLGHFQAQLLLTLLFVLFLTPYALLLRLFGQIRLPQGQWQDVEKQGSDLSSLKRTF